jgi:hypothetical protein
MFISNYILNKNNFFFFFRFSLNSDKQEVYNITLLLKKDNLLEKEAIYAINVIGLDI